MDRVNQIQQWQLFKQMNKPICSPFLSVPGVGHGHTVAWHSQYIRHAFGFISRRRSCSNYASNNRKPSNESVKPQTFLAVLSVLGDLCAFLLRSVNFAGSCVRQWVCERGQRNTKQLCPAPKANGAPIQVSLLKRVLCNIWGWREGLLIDFHCKTKRLFSLQNKTGILDFNKVMFAW